MSALSISRLGVRLGSRQVLDDISFDCEAGEFIGLIGPNGAGKSTFLRAVAGLVPHDGTIAMGGTLTTALAPASRARLIAYLAQEREIAWDVPVETVIALGRSPHLGPFAGLSDRDRAAIAEAMRTMEVAAVRRQNIWR